MLKTLQIIKYLRSLGYDDGAIDVELSEIAEGCTSEFFELSDSDVESIAAIYNNPQKLASAFKVASILQGA